MRLFRVPTDEGHGAAPTNLKLTQRQYENDVSSSTSPWLALQAQRLSVAVHIASAELRRGRSATEMHRRCSSRWGVWAVGVGARGGPSSATA